MPQLANKVDHHLRDHRLDPHADHVGRAADHARRDRRAGDRRGRGRRRDPASARARPEGRAADRPTRRCSCSSCRASSRHCDAVINITTGGSVTMTLEERLAAATDALAGDVLAQHGLDEFRALSDGAPLQDSGSTTGSSRISANSDDYIFRNTFTRHRAHRQAAGRRPRHAIRARVLRHRPPLQSRPLPRPRAGQAAGVPAADLRHPRRHRPGPRQPAVHEAHRRPPVRQRLSVVGAGRRAPPDQFLHHRPR